MPRYRVLEKSFMVDRIVEAGEEVDYDGYPGGNLEPLDDEARAKLKEYVEVVNPKRIADLAAANPDPALPNNQAFAKMIAEAIAIAFAEQNAAIAEGDAAVAEVAKRTRAPRATAPAAPAEPATPETFA